MASAGSGPGHIRLRAHLFMILGAGAPTGSNLPQSRVLGQSMTKGWGVWTHKTGRPFKSRLSVLPTDWGHGHPRRPSMERRRSKVRSRLGRSRGLGIYPQPHQLGLKGGWLSLHISAPQGISQFPVPTVKEEGVVCLGLQDSRVIRRHGEERETCQCEKGKETG